MASKKTAPPSPGELLEAISNLVVRIYADHVGRGPTKARAYADRDVIVCVLEDTLTRAEQTLVDSGRTTAAKQVRGALQEAMHDELSAGIEALPDRRVIAHTGSGTFEPDVMSELFILEGQTAVPRITASASARAGRPRPAGRKRPQVV
jgi:uncharacterized protein YbcI